MINLSPIPPKKPRVSLTKSQVQAGIGAELLSLCQSVTSDGSLSKEEIISLRKWLEYNRSSDLPAIGFLAKTVERILADGRVTKEERDELYKAIEAVLPPEARRQTAQARRAVEAEAKARLRDERDAQKLQEREQRDRDRSIRSANFMVAGVHYEGRPALISEHVSEGDQVFLARDSKNRFSRHAVEIRLRNGMVIGFVPEDDAADLAPLLDAGCPHQGWVTKVLAGGRVPIPVVQAHLYRADCGSKGLTFPEDVPPKQEFNSDSARKSGCLSVLMLVIIPAAIATAWLRWRF